MADELEAFFTRLARAMHAAGPGTVVQPVEVAEITARWLPYSRARGELSIPTNEDYELLLMRLFAGEGGYVFADESLQDDLRREVSSANPDLTALRTYGAARVTLAREHVRRVLDLDADALPAPAAPPRRASRPTPPNPSPVGDATAPAPASRTTAPPECQYCGQRLPTGRPVHYCPHCGLDIASRRCAGCSTELEPGWKFCVSCGRAA